MFLFFNKDIAIKEKVRLRSKENRFLLFLYAKRHLETNHISVSLLFRTNRNACNLKPYMVDLGYNIKEIGVMSGLAGTFIAFLSSFGGGFIIRRIRRYRARILFAVAILAGSSVFWSKVVFPAPLGPTMLTTSPWVISKSIPFNICIEQKLLVIPSKWIIILQSFDNVLCQITAKHRHIAHSSASGFLVPLIISQQYCFRVGLFRIRRRATYVFTPIFCKRFGLALLKTTMIVIRIGKTHLCNITLCSCTPYSILF